MAHPKFIAPGIRNQRSDEATDKIDKLDPTSTTPVNKKSTENKKTRRTASQKDPVKSYIEGDKNDIPEDDNQEYDDIERD